MKKVLLIVFCAFSLNAHSTEVKQDTIHKYIIDKEVITDFNGSQLEGKSISKYIIAYKNDNNKVIKNHIIITEKPAIALQPSAKVDNSLPNNALIIIDCKVREKKDLENILPENILSIDIHKSGSKVAESYGEKGKNGVVIINTKDSKTNNTPIYLIDGKRAEKKDVDKLSPEKIASITVNKKEGNGVIMITTKK